MGERGKNIRGKNGKYDEQCKQLKRVLGKAKDGINVSLLLIIAIHIASIVIGSLYLNKCPAERNIPIFLISIGVIGIVTKILGLARNFLSQYIKVDCIIGIIGLAEFIYFICGSVWVFSLFQPSYDPDDLGRYCNRTAYLFAFVYLCFIYIILLLGLLMVALFCCTCILSCCHFLSNDTDSEAARY